MGPVCEKFHAPPWVALSSKLPVVGGAQWSVSRVDPVISFGTSLKHLFIYTIQKKNLDPKFFFFWWDLDHSKILDFLGEKHDFEIMVNLCGMLSQKHSVLKRKKKLRFGKIDFSTLFRPRIGKQIFLKCRADDFTSICVEEEKSRFFGFLTFPNRFASN